MMAFLPDKGDRHKRIAAEAFAFAAKNPLLYKQPSSVRASLELQSFQIPTYMTEQQLHPHLLTLGWSLR
jgi:hypothetical protein